jgi:hypothetical protein
MSASHPQRTFSSGTICQVFTTSWLHGTVVRLARSLNSVHKSRKNKYGI